MGPFKKFNIFTFLIVIAAFALVLRIIDIASFPMRSSVAESKDPPQQFEKVATATPQEAAAAPTAPLEKAGAAKEAGGKETGDKKDAAAGNDSHATPPVSSPDVEPSFSAAEVETLQSLAKRREDLDRREQSIGQREALLKAASGEVDRKIAELSKIKTELEDLLGKQKTNEDAQYESLVKIYENMKPKDAANIFNTLEMDVLLPVIGKISERKASPILAAMNPDKAREVTIKLAEMRKLPQGGAKKDKKAPAATPATDAAPAPTAKP